MASSDDEVDDVVQSVSDYFFVDEEEEPISFSVLPTQWSQDESVDAYQRQTQVYLNGKADNGLKKVYKQVTAWKFDLSNVNVDIYVLTKENCWIKLLKPRKSYEEIIRTILITLHFLHFVRSNPKTSARSVWDHLSRVFSSYDARPSPDDLLDHKEFMDEAVKRDCFLAKCQFLLTFLDEKPQRKNLSNENGRASTSRFIVDDVDDIPEDVVEDESNEDGEFFDSVCAFCDNGGELLCCEGRCMRSFHATVEAGEDSMCVSLGFIDREVRAMQRFFCKNCEHKQHQCFVCGELGNSDKTSGAEVFQCANATCGYFFHPHCVAKLLHKDDKVAARELWENIAAGETFACPIHKCCICKQVEDKKKPDFQFAVCRRCPTSYHRKCLPREIAFEDIEEEGIITRAWENLLPNRILIYCLKHDIDDDLGTPIRDHINFPDDEDKERVVAEKKKKQTSAFPSGEDTILLKKRMHVLEKLGKTVGKASKELSPAAKKVKIASKDERTSAEPVLSRKTIANDTYKKSPREGAKLRLKEVERSSTANLHKTSLGGRLKGLGHGKKSGQGKLENLDNLVGSKGDKTSNTSSKKFSTELTPLDADSERRLLALFKEASSSVTMEDIVKKLDIPSTHVYSSRTMIDKGITQGRVEAAVEAVKTALKKLDEGCSIEDAKAVCEPGVLNQIFRWKSQLRVHLAPFLHGMRYTSFGRHFTKVEKLKEIVDMLHWYVQEGDMIVDFCCGANDFSCQMKKKLEETGKKCSYKNYDLFQPKNDFNFEKRDWMTVRKHELREGNQLIMGLNPPFGVKAALANKFINKALEFKPKLLILIVPPETERLDQKKQPYDLVWEYSQFLSGKSFYFPGSVDENDKQIDQWNVIAPPLYLWSRHDWSAKHKAIAVKHGHLSRQQGSNFKEDCPETFPKRRSVEDLRHKVDAWMKYQEPEDPKYATTGDQDCKRSSPCTDGKRESQDSYGPGNSQSSKTSKKKMLGEGQRGRGMSKESADRQNGRKPRASDAYNRKFQHCPTNVVDGVSSPERSPKIPSNAVVGETVYQHPKTSVSGSGTKYGTAYGWNGGISADMSGKYNLNNDESFSLGICKFSGGANFTGRSMGHMRASAEGIGHRSSIMEGFDTLYGEKRSFSPTLYGQLGSTEGLAYGMNELSAMQRYAPRLDELNNRRMSNLGPDPSMFHGHGIYGDPRAPGPAYHVDSMGFAPAPQHPHSMDFAPAPQHPHSHSSAGWLNQ